jgi:hypothetical protein
VDPEGTPVPDPAAEAQLRCFRCDRELELFAGEPDCPQDAVVFTATGNYGSRLWDPLTPGRWLEIVACDACLADRAVDGRVRQAEQVAAPGLVTRTRFDPEGQA